MKIVIYHWTDIRVLGVPNECPTDTAQEMMDWIAKHPDPTKYEGCDPYEIRRDTDNCEIVDVRTTSSEDTDGE